MKKRRYTKTSVEKVVRLYNRGYNFTQIAEELGCCRNTVRKKIRDYVATTGNYVYINVKPSISKITLEKMLKLYKSGKSVKEIASVANISLSYIYKKLGDFNASR